jgi:hypothetical protein
MQSSAGHAGFLVVAAAADPPAEERFVLHRSPSRPAWR